MPLVAIVGSRRPSSYGRAVTRKLVGELVGSGVGIVSGLALGIDAEAHWATIEAGGYTIAVLGNGIDFIQPPSNHQLGERILKSGGAIVSEYTPGTPGLKQHFPARNRIIAGLAQVTVVVEGSIKSGARHTIEAAHGAGREVMAVPGPINSDLSALPHQMMRDGAKPVWDATDILRELKIEPDQRRRARTNLPAEQQQILKQLAAGPLAAYQLSASWPGSAEQLATQLTLLELSGLIYQPEPQLWAQR